MNDLFQEKAKEWDTNDRAKVLSSGIGGAILKQVQLRPDMQVLDFGAGTGLISSQVAPRVGHITAVDISQAMLEKLAAKEELKGKVSIVCQDITQTPLNTQFDLIMSAMAMHHVEDTDQMLKSFASHLKPGGQVALADLDLEDGTFHAPGTQGVYHDGFDRNLFANKLLAQGFTQVRFETACMFQGENRVYPVFLVTARLA